MNSKDPAFNQLNGHHTGCWNNLCSTWHLFGPESELNQNDKPCRGLAQVPNKKHAITWDQGSIFLEVGKRSGSIVDQIVRARGVKAASVTAATYTDPIQTLQLLGVSPVKKKYYANYVCELYQRLDGPQWLKKARQQMSPPLIGQQTQTGFCESLLRHAQLPSHKMSKCRENRTSVQMNTTMYYIVVSRTPGKITHQSDSVLSREWSVTDVTILYVKYVKYRRVKRYQYWW